MTTVKAIKGATSVRAAPRQALAATQQVPTRGGPGGGGDRKPGAGGRGPGAGG